MLSYARNEHINIDDKHKDQAFTMSTSNTNTNNNSNSNNDEDMPLPTSVNGIPLAALLSSCIDACHRGCEVIRSVHCRSLLAASAHEDHDTSDPLDDDELIRETSDGSMILPPSRQIAHTFKSTSHNTLDPLTNSIVIDPRSALTEADEASQAVVVECLRSCWGDFMEGDGGNTTSSRPRLWIVGEEDDNEESLLEKQQQQQLDDSNQDVFRLFDKYGVQRPDHSPIDRDLIDLSHQQPPTASIANMNDAELIVFIDPLDGTREYIENRIHNVQCLIGITLNGIPIAGAVGLPFGSGAKEEEENESLDRDNVIQVAYGWIMPNNSHRSDASSVICSGVKHFQASNKLPVLDSYSTELQSTTTTDNNGLLSTLHTNNDQEDDTLIILSGDSKKPALKLTMDCLDQVLSNNHPLDTNNDTTTTSATALTSTTCIPHRKIISGGCGNKILYLARRHQLLSQRKSTSNILGTISISPPGSSSWDTAAPTAVLLSMDPEAHISDLLGRPLVYNGKDLTNVYGVVVSSGEGAVKVHRELCERLSKNREFCTILGVGGCC
jgi:3'-phosphoadenosine 5'-phosphosulfate (PAPS) 3'-phosphatase